jgi:hypothetical protein
MIRPARLTSFTCIHFTVVTALVSVQIEGMLMRGVVPLFWPGAAA